jgi:hypothetical protein
LAFSESQKGHGAAIVQPLINFVGQQPKPVPSAELKQLPLVFFVEAQPKGFEGEV